MKKKKGGYDDTQKLEIQAPREDEDQQVGHQAK